MSEVSIDRFEGISRDLHSQSPGRAGRLGWGRSTWSRSKEGLGLAAAAEASRGNEAGRRDGISGVLRRRVITKTADGGFVKEVPLPSKTVKYHETYTAQRCGVMV